MFRTSQTALAQRMGRLDAVASRAQGVPIAMCGTPAMLPKSSGGWLRNWGVIHENSGWMSDLSDDS